MEDAWTMFLADQGGLKDALSIIQQYASVESILGSKMGMHG